MTLTEDQTLSFGLSAGIINTSSDPDWVVPTPVPDPYLPQAYSQTEVIGDIGLIYRIKRFTTALSVTQLTNESSTKSYQSARHYYFNANYNFGSEEKLQIRPQLLIRTDLVKASMDVNSLFIYKNRYTLGLTYRTSDALCILAGYTVRNKFTISYSYDLTINKLSSVSRGSHEIHLGFLLK
jgi:type IX secretion system PorP/SprF family membrane protein